MSGPIKQVGFILVFASLLATVFVLRHYLDERADGALSHEEALERYGFYLEEVSKKSGIDFTHEAPVLDHRLDHIMPLVASMGASVSVVDYDKSGHQSLYVVTSVEGGKNHLYRNKGDGTFEDVAEQLGIADLNKPGTGFCMGAVWGDFDNDGYEDLLVYKWGKPELFHNDQGKGFTPVTEQANLPKWINANTAIWLDYDADGRLDLFIAGYWREDINLSKLETTAIMPESFEYANNGGRKYLLRNRGNDKDGKWLGFEDVTEAMGIDSHRWTLGAAATDLRGTGFPDIVLANDYGINEFFANQGGKKFVEMGQKTGVGDHPKSGMSVSFGDISNRGRFSLYITNITEPGILAQGNNLWVPDPGKTGDAMRYRNMATALGVDKGGWSWGAQFGDLNNDGLVDLYLTNGNISADRNNNYWYDYSSKVAGNSKFIIADAKNWPDMQGRSLSGYQQKCLWLNRGGRFDSIGRAVGVSDTYDGRAVALVDLWNRGCLDVVVANQKGPLLVYKNTVTQENDWIQFELEGTRSNRSAIGAQVRLYWSGQEQVQDVSGGSGYASQNQRRVHFGLGKNAQVERVEIRWPSGTTQTIDSPRTGVCHMVKEPQ